MRRIFTRLAGETMIDADPAEVDLVHHHASMQVFAEAGGRSRFVWITDVQSHSCAEPVAAMVDQGTQVIRRTLSRRPPPLLDTRGRAGAGLLGGAHDLLEGLRGEGGPM
ncbi:hypothetical protein ACFW9D_10735 [Streptomyces sp. NPDC059524]|uniref:hypothetical protein n=1 Tax=Streptomyces sp. NPDC059524 TaxID=3346856 RepID=UPI0036AA4AE7